MAIKNWTVKTKQIKKKSKGLINHFNYLFNDKREAHFYSDIVDLNNSSDKLNNILDEVDKRQEYRRDNGLRGGGVSNLATSFVLSIPRDIQQPTTKKEWQKMAHIALKELANDIDIPFEKIQKNAVVVLHDESNSIDKSSHIHILVGNVIDGKVVKPISQYQGTYSMKKGFNKAVKHVLKEDNNNYVPLNANVGDKPLFAARAEKLEKQKEKLNEDFEYRKSILINKNKQLNKKEERIFNNEIDLNMKVEEFEEEKTKFGKAVKYAKTLLSKWITSLLTDQKKELEKLAAQSAKVIVDIEEQLPEVAKELVGIAQIEETKAEALELLKDESKVTVQIEKVKKKRDRKKRTRPSKR